MNEIPEDIFNSLINLAMDQESLILWLNSPCKAFDGFTPLQILERGEGDRIRRMIYQLEYGVLL